MKLYKEETKDIVHVMQNRNPFFEYLTQKTMRQISEIPPGTLIDLGCGSGRIVIAAAKQGWKVVGVDTNSLAVENGIAYAREEGVVNRTTFLKCDIGALPKKMMGTFDVVTMQEVIEHVEDYQLLLDTAYRLLVPGGILILTTPHNPHLWTVFDDYAEHVRRFRREEVEVGLKKFKEVHIATIGFPFYLYLRFLYDKVLRTLGKTHKARYFRRSFIGYWFSYCFGWCVMWCDDFFSWTPWGETLWVVAKK